MVSCDTQSPPSRCCACFGRYPPLPRVPPQLPRHRRPPHRPRGLRAEIPRLIHDRDLPTAPVRQPPVVPPRPIPRKPHRTRQRLQHSDPLDRIVAGKVPDRRRFQVDADEMHRRRLALHHRRPTQVALDVDVVGRHPANPGLAPPAVAWEPREDLPMKKYRDHDSVPAPWAKTEKCQAPTDIPLFPGPGVIIHKLNNSLFWRMLIFQ